MRRSGGTVGAVRAPAGRARCAGAGCRPGRAVASTSGDVRDADALARAAADFIARFGAPDIVIANAGISRGTLTEHADDLPTFRAVLDTNVLGMVHTFPPFLAAMQAARRGALVGIASIAGFRGLAGLGRVFGVEGRGDRLSREPARRAAGTGIAVRHHLPRLHRDADDRENPYPMPFLLDADEAARLIARAIERRRRFYVLPWQMAIVGRVLRCCRARSTTRCSRARRASRGSSD